MLRKLVAKVLKSLLNKVETKEVKTTRTVEDYCAITATDSDISRAVKAHDTHETKQTNIHLMDNRELQTFINDSIEQIQAELMVKGYKELENILEQHETVCIQAFVISQLNSLGQYDPEKDNVEQYNRAALIRMAKKLNQQQYIQRMKDNGKNININPSASQIETIKKLCKLNKKQYKAPEDKFEASEMIESLIAMSPKKDDNMSEAQKNAIKNMCAALGKNFDTVMLTCKDRKSASEVIGSLSKEIEENNIDTKATDKQVSYVKRLLQLQKKRWTAKREEQYSNMSMKEIKEVINTLQAECKELGLLNDKASEGQVNYIISLGKRLKKRYNIEEVKELHKDKASEIIEKLQRELLYMLYLGNGHKMSKAEINIMPLITVRQLIEQLDRERTTNYYEKNAEQYSGSQMCL